MPIIDVPRVLIYPILLIRRNFFRTQTRILKDFIFPGASILDIGSGNGMFGDLIAREYEVRIICADIYDRHEFEVPFVQSDGKALPFPTNSFDTVLLYYTLHHVLDPEMTLAEAVRVSRKYVIIHEDIPTNSFERVLAGLHGRSFRLIAAGSRGSFRTDMEWEKVFYRLHVNLIRKKRIYRLAYPIHRYEFILSKK